MAVKISGTTVVSDSRELSNITSIDATTKDVLESGLGLGSAAFLDAGTDPNQLVQLDAEGRLPELDGSNLTNISGFSIATAIAFA
jgi:hypothetical protein